MLSRIVLATLLSLLTPLAGADMTATTEDGRKVLLRGNGTWDWYEPAADGDRVQPRALLTLEKKFDIARGCRIGMRLQNDLNAQIRTLVLRFTAYKGDEIAFETVSRGFSYIKPTVSQYQEVTFRGIRCADITSVEVFAARNCHVGELTKYSASAEHCLALVDVAPSDLLPFTRRKVVD